MIADDLVGNVPILERDLFWNDVQPELPNTAASFGLKNTPQIGSTANIL